MRCSKDKTKDVAVMEVFFEIRERVAIFVAILVKNLSQFVMVKLEKFLQMFFSGFRWGTWTEAVDQVNGGTSSSAQLKIQHSDPRWIALIIVSVKNKSLWLE